MRWEKGWALPCQSGPGLLALSPVSRFFWEPPVSPAQSSCDPLASSSSLAHAA